MVTDRERARELLHDLFILSTRKTENKIIKHFAAVRAERDAEWEAKDLYTHDDMDCACENGRLEERRKWSAAAEEMVAALNELQQIPTITLLTPGRIIKARDALNALIKEVKPCGS